MTRHRADSLLKRLWQLVSSALILGILPLSGASAQSVVVPGGFCSTSGKVAVASNGRTYVCSTSSTDRRRRWRPIRTTGNKVANPGATSGGSSTTTTTTPVAPVAAQFEFGESSKRWAFLDGDGDTFCAIDLSGQATCLGNDSYGSLGDGGDTRWCGERIYCARIAQVNQPEPFTMLSVQSNAVCALGQSKRIFCWGLNVYGQLGIGSVVPQSTPVPITSDQAFQKVSLGTYGACGLTTTGEVFCWGRNAMGLIGNGAVRYSYDVGIVPTRISASTRFVDVSVGGDFACAASDDGSLWCWGAAWGTNHPESLATSTPFVSRKVASDAMITTGHYSTCVLESSVVTCWGILPGIVKAHNREGIIGAREAWGNGCTWTRNDVICSDNNRDGGGSFDRNSAKLSLPLPVSSVIRTFVNGYIACALSIDGQIACYEWTDGEDQATRRRVNVLKLVKVFS